MTGFENGWSTSSSEVQFSSVHYKSMGGLCLSALNLSCTLHFDVLSYSADVIPQLVLVIAFSILSLICSGFRWEMGGLSSYYCIANS